MLPEAYCCRSYCYNMHLYPGQQAPSCTSLPSEAFHQSSEEDHQSSEAFQMFPEAYEALPEAFQMFPSEEPY